jgi:ribosome-binding factor A
VINDLSSGSGLSMPKGDFERVDRVNRKLHEILARTLLEEVRDPRLQNVEITDVEVSPDIKHAEVYFLVMAGDPDDAQKKRAKKGLQRAGSFLRKKAGQKLDTKFTPELHFEYDDSVERGRRIEELLRAEHESSDDSDQ